MLRKPPDEPPSGRNLMPPAAPRFSRLDCTNSILMPAGMRTPPPEAPEVTMPCATSMRDTTSRRWRSAELRSERSSAAISCAVVPSSAGPGPRATRGNTIPATRPRMASARTSSKSAKPASACLFVGDVARIVGAPLPAVGAQRDDLIGRLVARDTIFVGVPPGVQRQRILLQVRPVPVLDAGFTGDQHVEALRLRRVAAGVEVEQIERRGERIDLQLGRLRPGVGEVAEHARPDEAHDQAEDDQHDKQLDEREAAVAVALAAGSPHKVSQRN